MAFQSIKCALLFKIIFKQLEKTFIYQQKHGRIFENFKSIFRIILMYIRLGEGDGKGLCLRSFKSPVPDSNFQIEP